jgi:hypothetical protein
VENLWIEWVAWSEGQKQIPCGDNNKKSNDKSKSDGKSSDRKATAKSERLRDERSLSDLYISILVN